MRDYTNGPDSRENQRQSFVGAHEERWAHTAEAEQPMSEDAQNLGRRPRGHLTAPTETYVYTGRRWFSRTRVSSRAAGA